MLIDKIPIGEINLGIFDLESCDLSSTVFLDSDISIVLFKVFELTGFCLIIL